MTTPLGGLLETYKQTLLDQSFIRRISERERGRHFPFAYHNIYRIFLAIAPVFFEGLCVVGRRGNWRSPNILSASGKPGRVVRYLHVALVGAWWASRLSDSAHAALMVGTQILSERCADQVVVEAALLTEAQRCLRVSQANPALISRLAVYLREFVDYIYLGQHDHGFVGYPPVRLPGVSLVIRRFHSMSVLGASRAAIDVFTTYEENAARTIIFDAFRGECGGIPGPSDLCQGAAVLSDSDHVLTNQDVSALISTVEREMIATRASLEAMTECDAATTVALWFCAELFALLACVGENVASWQDRIVKTVRETHHVPTASLPPSKTFTEIYLGELRQAVSFFAGAAD